MTTHTVEIDIYDYKNFSTKLMQYASMSGQFHSRQYMRRIIRQHFNFDVRHYSGKSSWHIYLTPEDAVIFKLSFS